MANEDCIFCKIVAGELPAMINDEDEQTLAFMDIMPATRGHALVIPKRHVSDLWEIDEEQFAVVARAAHRLAQRIRERLEPDGVNLINSCRSAAWQTVFHLHVHVIPRYRGDALPLPWLPTDGDMTQIAALAAQLR